jgi:hypothetical protein
MHPRRCSRTLSVTRALIHATKALDTVDVVTLVGAPEDAVRVQSEGAIPDLECTERSSRDVIPALIHERGALESVPVVIIDVEVL